MFYDSFSLFDYKFWKLHKSSFAEQSKQINFWIYQVPKTVTSQKHGDTENEDLDWKQEKLFLILQE